MTEVIAVADWVDAGRWQEKIYSTDWVAGEGEPMGSFEPATGELLATVGSASAADVARACARAGVAQVAWARRPIQERVAVLRRAVAVMEARRDEIAEWVVRESGGVGGKGLWEVAVSIEELHQAIALALLPAGDILPSTVPGELSLARRVPVGVVAVINPFNAPFFFAMRGVAAGLALGNAVVLKPDPHTPVSGGVLVARVMEEAGLPADLLHVLPGGAETGAAMVTDPGTGLVFFTGSTATGRIIGELAGRHFKRALLELGGNNPFIVLDDADVERAASHGAASTFRGQGQGCIVAGRHLVHESLVDAYAAALKRHAESMKVGDGRDPTVTVGPIINERQAIRIEGLVTDSVAAGANVVTGSGRDGLFYGNTVLTDVGPGMPVYEQEIFGPVAAIIPFATDDEAVELANDTEYGLTSAIHTRSVSRGMAIADRLHVGMCHINGQTAENHAFVPFGGVGSSGNGTRFGGVGTLEQFTEWKWITANEVPPPTQFG